MSNTFVMTLLAVILSAICLTQLCCSARMAGGWSALDIGNERVKNLTTFSVDMYNKRSNAAHYKQLIRVKEAKQQLVAGVKYEISFDIGDTNCSKNGIQENCAKDCPVTNTDTYETCTATIWERVWLNSTKLLDMNCVSH